MNVYKQEQSRKTNNGPQKNENEHAQIDVTRWVVHQKKTSTKRGKKTSNKSFIKEKKNQTTK